jgi:hypothetical protein
MKTTKRSTTSPPLPAWRTFQQHRADRSFDQGAPLENEHREFFESRLGHDFSHVRIHTDEAAATSSRELSANAYASGEDIVFASGRYRPETLQGSHLLAHELAHVAQQQTGGSAGPAQAEPQARAAADRAVQGESVPSGEIGGAPVGLYCDPEDDKKKAVDTLLPSSSLKLTEPGPLDWLKLRQSFDTRGLRLSLRDADDIEAEARRIANQLAVFGIDKNFKLNYGLGTLTRDDIINMGLGKQLENQLGAEHPNSWDRMNKQWDLAHPGGFSTPFISKTWSF